jgi:hypothetical protein
MQIPLNYLNPNIKKARTNPLQEDWLKEDQPPIQPPYPRL